MANRQGPPTRTASVINRIAHHPVRVGVAGMALVVAIFGTIYALLIPPFLPPDEASHVAFALELSRGNYPAIDTQPTELPIPGMPDDHLTWVANHPPLYYLFAGMGLRVFIAAGMPLEGLYAVRLANVAVGVLTVVAVAWLALIVTRRRPHVAIGAAALGGLIPHFVSTSAFAYNDAVAVLAATASLGTAAVVLVRGPTAWRVAILTLAVTLAIAIRSSGAAALLAGVGAVWLGTVLHGWATPEDRDEPRWLRIGAATTLGFGVGAIALLLGGWAYLFNVGRYGSPTATSALMTLHGRAPRGSVWSILADDMFWRDLWGQLMSQIVEVRIIPDPRSVQFIAFATLAGLGIAAGGGIVHRLKGERFDSGRGWAVVMLACYAAVIVFTLADFVSHGGSQHARYLYPAVAVIGIAVAYGLTGLPFGRYMPWVVIATGVWVITNVDRLRQFLVEAYGLDTNTGLVTGLLHASDVVRVPAPPITLSLIGLLMVFGLTAWLAGCYFVARGRLAASRAANDS